MFGPSSTSPAASPAYSGHEFRRHEAEIGRATPFGRFVTTVLGIGRQLGVCFASVPELITRSGIPLATLKRYLVRGEAAGHWVVAARRGLHGGRVIIPILRNETAQQAVARVLDAHARALRTLPLKAIGFVQSLMRKMAHQRAIESDPIDPQQTSQLPVQQGSDHPQPVNIGENVLPDVPPAASQEPLTADDGAGTDSEGLARGAEQVAEAEAERSDIDDIRKRHPGTASRELLEQQRPGNQPPGRGRFGTMSGERSWDLRSRSWNGGEPAWSVLSSVAISRGRGR